MSNPNSSPPRWLRERSELASAMRNAPTFLHPEKCDMAPPMELVGVYMCMASVSRLCHRGQLSLKAGAYLNGILGCEAFCILHHCTHESISRGREEFRRIENAAFRLGCLILFFDDGYREAHRKHHQSTNEEDDPDRIMSHTSLPVLGSMMVQLNSRRSYLSLGVPLTDWMVTWAHWLGLTEVLVNSSLTKRLIRYDHVLFKMLSYEVLGVLGNHKDYESILRTTRATWRSSAQLSVMLLALFFARYPHKNAPELKDENDSFYDATYRGQGQVDLFMMGEGAHHMHHAKSDVSYSRLGKVALEVERDVKLKTTSRSNGDVTSLEYTNKVAPKTTRDAQPPMQFAFERARAVESGLRSWKKSGAQVALTKMSDAVIRGAFHVVKRADRSFLRKVYRDMQLGSTRESVTNHPLPIAGWETSILSDATTSELLCASEKIRIEIEGACSEVASRLRATDLYFADERAVRENYVHIFVAIADAFVGQDSQSLFVSRLSERFHVEPTAPLPSRENIVKRLKAQLERPIPSDFFRLRKIFKKGILSNLYNAVGHGSEAATRVALRRLLFAVGEDEAAAGKRDTCAPRDDKKDAAGAAVPFRSRL